MTFDGRAFNFRKNPSKLRRIRVLNPGNVCGESFGITIPEIIAKKFEGCWMKIYQSGTAIIIESGCKIQEIKK